MAVLAVSALGAAVGGSLITGTFLGLSGAAIGWTVGGLLGSALFPPKGQQGPRLGDLRVAGTEYGQPIPYVLGNPRVAGQIVWASNKRETATSQSAGKGGGPEVTTYTYDVDLVILLSENPITGVSRIWSNGDLVYNGDVTRAGIWGGLTIYTGTDEQLPDPTYEAGVGAGNTPAYRGRGYVVISGLQLGQSGQIPNLTFELATATTFGQLFKLPLTPTTEFNDVINPTQAISFFDGDYTFGSNGVTLRSAPVAPDSGRFGFGFAPDPAGGWKTHVGGTQDCYYSFELNIVDTIGIPSQPNDGIPFFRVQILPSGGNFDLYLYITDSLNFELYLNSKTGGGAKIADIGTLAKVDIILRAPAIPGDPVPLEFYANSVLGYSTTVPGPNWAVEITARNNSFGSFYGVEAFAVKNLTFGIGEPPEINLSPVPVNEAVSNIALRAGMSLSDFDVDNITSYEKPVRALAVGQVSNSRSVLEQFQGAFFFEASKSDKVYFRARSSTPVATIPYADLRASDSPDSQDEPFPLNTAGDLEIPAQASLTYPNMAADYNNATEYSFRVNAAQDSVESVSSALGMLPEEAKGVVDALMVEKVSSQTKSTIKVGLEYAYIEPGDVINVTNDDGRVYRMRVGTKKDNLTTIELELVLDDVGAIDFAAITADDYVLTEDVRQVAPTIWEALDIPLLRDADNENGYYVAVAPDRATADDIWDGAVFVRKWSTGDFENRFISGDACVMGTCQTTLGDWTGSNVFDESNSVTVRVTGELSSTTRNTMLNSVETNLAIVGNELIRFRLATFIQSINGENEYKLTGLLRGQRGTEQYQTGHTSSERFVLLNSLMRNVIDQNSQIDLPSEVKAVTLNLPLSSVTAEAFTNTAVRLKPFSVVQLRALADGSDLEITWNRRTRLSYRYGGTIGTSVPLGEATEAYRVRIYDGSTLVRTEDVTTNSYTYSAADIATDGFSSGATATIEVVQLSEIVGEGFPAEVEGIIP